MSIMTWSFADSPITNDPGWSTDLLDSWNRRLAHVGHGNPLVPSLLLANHLAGQQQHVPVPPPGDKVHSGQPGERLSTGWLSSHGTPLKQILCFLGTVNETVRPPRGRPSASSVICQPDGGVN